MIPILYSAGTTTFTHNGLGLLMDVLTCSVAEELNGVFEMSMTYPVDGIHAEEIEVNCIVRVEPRENSSAMEPFRIYRISRNISGQLTIYAQHISYQLNYIPVMPITSASMTASAALSAITSAQNLGETNPYTITTDITTTAEFGVKEPKSIRSVLGGVEGSFLDVYGGEIVWSYPTVQILQSRGSDNGIVVEYGRNMLEMTNEDSMPGVITGICPYARYTQTTTEGDTTASTEVIVTLTEKVVESAYADVFPFRRTICVDLSDKFTDNAGQAITEEQLRTAATEYITQNALGVPRFGIEVSLINPNHDLGYTLLNASNTISLGDTVTVKYSALELTTTEKVTKLVYDVLRERYESVTVGKAIQDLSDTIVGIQEDNQILV